MATVFLKVANNAAGTLLNTISDIAISLELAAGEGSKFPSTFPFPISIDGEILNVGARAGDVLSSLTRGEEGTGAAEHTAGAAVRLNITAEQIQDIHDAVNALEDSYNGTFLESFTFVITEAGGTITGTLDKDPSGDLTQRFSDGESTLNSGTSISITPAGADTTPVKRYIYILQTGKTVLVEGSDWPVTEHIKIAEVIVQTAATVGTDGPLAVRFWNDPIQGTGDQGHHTHAWERLRWEHSAYRIGSAVTWSGSGTGALDLAITAGKVYQLHVQDVSAFDTTDPAEVLVPNHDATPYLATADIETLVADSAGGSLSNRYYNLVIWCSVSSGAEVERVFINLPSGSYLLQDSATSDVSGFDNLDIPSDFRGYAYLIQRVTIKHSPAAGGTWTIIQENDLRGQVPNVAAGGGVQSTAHNLLDGSRHPDTAVDSVTRGSLIVGNSTPEWDELVVGSAGRILKSDGSDPAWVDDTAVIAFIIDGGGAEIAVGIHGDMEIPFDCEIQRVTMLADQSGSIVVDIWKDTYANYPPTDADSITASAVPTITTAVKSQDATLTGWTTSISAGDTLRYNVDSVTDIERVTVSFYVHKT